MESQAQSQIVRTLIEGYAQRRLKNPSFSVRAYSRRLAISPGTLSQLMNGKRKVTRTLGIQILEKLGTDPSESRELCKTLQLRYRAPKQKSSLDSLPSPSSYPEMAMDQYSLVADWYHFAILSLAEIRGFKADPEWIAKRLGISKSDAQDALDRLLRIQLLVKSPGGKTRPSTSATTTSDDVPNAAIRYAHVQALQIAQQALEDVPVELRDFSKIIFPMDPKRLPEAKKLIQDFRRRLATLLESGDKKEVCQLSVQLFPLTKGQS